MSIKLCHLVHFLLSCFSVFKIAVEVNTVKKTNKKTIIPFFNQNMIPLVPALYLSVSVLICTDIPN